MKRTQTSSPAAERGDTTRHKLLLAAIEVFGRLGYDGATTRALAVAAGVNLQAIPYHFGGKEGLYQAVVAHIADHIAARMGPLRLRLAARFAAEAHGQPIIADEARVLLVDLLRTLAEFLIRPEMESWARVVIREQMEPSPAFDHLFRVGMEPQFAAARLLVGRATGLDPAGEGVGVRTFGLIGGVLMFRTAHGAVLRGMGWETMGPEQIALIRRLVEELVAGLPAAGEATR